MAVYIARRLVWAVFVMAVVGSVAFLLTFVARELANEPADDAQWEQARADAAIAAEAGNLLLAQPPPKGSPVGWRQRATDFRAAAQTLRDAVERRDFAAAQESLRELPRACAACHVDYR